MNKKSVAIASAVVAVILIMPVLIVCAAGLIVPDQYTKTFTSELVDKVHLLYGTDGPKIVVIGGSSVAFGLDSSLMSEKTGMPVVNFGLYASLGTRVMIELSKDALGEGDVVILSPETDPQTMSMFFGAAAMWQATEEDRSILCRLPSDMKKEMALVYRDYVADKCRLWSTGTPDPDGVYRRDSFNSSGDLVYSRPQSRMPLGYDPSNIIDVSPDTVGEDFIAFVNDYVKFAEGKGATVYFTFAPMNSAALRAGTTERDLYDYWLFLCSALDCRIISDTKACVMEPGYFYDSNFHLNDSGRTVWTARLTRDVLRESGRVVSLDLNLPSAPELPRGAEPVGEDGNDVFFAFREIRNESGDLQWYSVSGLSEKGKAEKELTVPRTHLGYPVHGIGSGAFASSVLESVTVLDNIYSIESGAFSGAPALRALHIFNEDESTVAVDQLTLFDGASPDLKIYLYSEKSYRSFITGYFWSNYGGRMVLRRK